LRNHLQDRVVVITGAGNGFGRLMAQMAAELGARVVGADINVALLAETFDALDIAGHTVAYHQTDVSDLTQMHALAAFAVERFGAIDVMINNAGVMPLAFFADHARAADAWSKAIDINIKGVLNGISAVHDQMIAQGRGHVVNISSTYSNFPTEGAAVYAATKTAVNTISESLRVETQGKIKVTIVRPTGVIATGLGSTIVNPRGAAAISGHHARSFVGNFAKYAEGTLPPEMTDRDNPRYWALAPEDIAEQVIYVINQPWGVTISDITVRATGEEYIL
jgi:NADP-dependent 3-hydroxy acid dehydrogenase YdfG